MNSPRPAVRYVNPPGLPQPAGYSHTVEATGGKTIYISGQVALDRNRALVGEKDLSLQARQVFANLRTALEAVGADFGHVVKLTYYLLDISQLQVVREVRDQFVNTHNPPASSAVEVRRLFRDDLLIEVDAIAVVPG